MIFQALLHKFAPEAIVDYSNLIKEEPTKRVKTFLEAAENYGIPSVIDVEDIVEKPDSFAIITYLTQFFQVFGNSSSNTVERRPRLKTKDELKMTAHSELDSEETQVIYFNIVYFIF